MIRAISIGCVEKKLWLYDEEKVITQVAGDS